MATANPWFYTSLFKPAGLQPTWPPVLEDNTQEVEAILQINKRGIHAKVNWVGYDSSKNQQIWLQELQDTDPKVVKTFLKKKKREKGQFED